MENINQANANLKKGKQSLEQKQQKYIIRHREDHQVMTKDSIYQEDISILFICLNKRASKYGAKINRPTGRNWQSHYHK